MTRWFALQEADDELFRTAEFRFEHTVEIAAAPDRVWHTLTADDALVSWAKGITGAEWTTPRPLGVGATRTVTVARGAAALKERFYRWEDVDPQTLRGRMTFYCEAASRPGFTRFGEDVRLEPNVGGTRLTWAFAADAAPWFAPVLRLGRPVINRVTRSWVVATEGAC